MSLGHPHSEHCRDRPVVKDYGLYSLAARFVEGKRVLDVACGAGYGSRLLRESGAGEVTGIDISQDRIDHARGLSSDAGIRFIVGDAHELGDAVEGTFDVIVCFEAIEHVCEPALLIESCRRLSHAETRLIFSVAAQGDEPPDATSAHRQVNHLAFRAMLEDAFTTTVFLPYSMSLSTIIGDPNGLGFDAPLHSDDKPACGPAEEPGPQGCVAICCLSKTLVDVGNLIIHSRKSYDEDKEDRLWLGLQQRKWLERAEQREEQMAAWRGVAKGYERTMAEQERVCHWLETAREKLEYGREQLEGEKHELADANERLRLAGEQLRQRKEEIERHAARITAELVEARNLVRAMEATQAWRLATRLRAMFPAESSRGRAVRKSLRLARPFERFFREPARDDSSIRPPE